MIDAESAIANVRRAVERIRNGGMVIMVDDEDRENEGDLVYAAECSTPSLINFMVKEARGLVCLALEPALVDRLKLPLMADSSGRLSNQTTAFTVSIEARHGVSTGISAADRNHTIRVAIDDQTLASDIVVPGHVFPLKARSGGVLERAGHTEGSVDLARLARFKGAGVICEIMNDDGSMARMPELKAFAAKHEIPMLAIADLIQFRLMHESLVRVVSQKPVRTSHGTFEGVVFESTVDGSRHFALVKGHEFGDKLVDVRVHSQRPLVDVFGDPDKAGRMRIEYGLTMLSESDRGVLVYLSTARSGDRFASDLDDLAAEARDGSEHIGGSSTGMDLRLHGTGAQIVRSLGVRKMRVHATSPKSLKGLSGFGLEVVETIVIRDQ